MRNAFCKALLALSGALIVVVADSPRISADTIVNNILSPFSTIKIIGSRPGPRPHWSRECNQGFSEWRPVCGVTLNRVAVTYPNRCMAELDNAIVIDEERPCPISASCAPTYEPVCGRLPPDGPLDFEAALRPPTVKAFINECFARAPMVFRLTTDNPPGLVPEQFNGDVLIIRKYGDDLFRYPQHSQRYNYYGRSGLEDFSEVCPKSCPEGGLVVCAVDHNNVPRLYKNRCSAIKAGADLSRYKLGEISKCK